jgi:hypothetical protein
LSVDADHARFVEDDVVPEAERPAGTEGAVVSVGTVTFELATDRAGTASVTPLEKVAVMADPLMFAAWYVRTPFLTKTACSGVFAVTDRSTVPRPDRLLSQ